MEPKYRPIGIKLMWKDMEKCFIPMVITFKANTIIQKNMEEAYMFGVVTKPNIKDNLKKIHFKVKLEFILLINNFILEE